MDKLIDCDAIDAAQKASKYSNYLWAALRSNDARVLDRSAQALGHLARPGRAYIVELVEAEVTSAFEWLQPDNKQESRKLAAVLLMRELAKNSPTLFYGFIPQIFDLTGMLVATRKKTFAEQPQSLSVRALRSW